MTAQNNTALKLMILMHRTASCATQTQEPFNFLEKLNRGLVQFVLEFKGCTRKEKNYIYYIPLSVQEVHETENEIFKSSNTSFP